MSTTSCSLAPVDFRERFETPLNILVSRNFDKASLFCYVTQQPMRNFSDAAARGSRDSLEGVMTSCVWGKEAPIGTGINIDLRWQLRKASLLYQ